MTDLKAYPVWDAGVRRFHWINLLCMIGLIAVGVVILNAKVLGVPNDGKILLKTVHVWIGYVFALNLAWRLVWAFIGGPYARWRAILPGGRGYLSEVRAYLSDFSTGQPPVPWAQSARAPRSYPAAVPVTGTGRHGAGTGRHGPVLPAHRFVDCRLGGQPGCRSGHAHALREGDV
jgi:hypothetical protein